MNIPSMKLPSSNLFRRATRTVSSPVAQATGKPAAKKGILSSKPYTIAWSIGAASLVTAGLVSLDGLVRMTDENLKAKREMVAACGDKKSYNDVKFTIDECRSADCFQLETQSCKQSK